MSFDPLDPDGILQSDPMLAAHQLGSEKSSREDFEKRIREAFEKSKPAIPRPSLAVIAPSGEPQPSGGIDNRVRQQFPVTTVQGLLDRKPPRDLIQGVLPEGGVTLLVSVSGGGKTHIVCSWAFSLALGESWFGRRTRPCNVVIVNAEGNPAYRIRAAISHRGIDPAQLERLVFIDRGFRLIGPDSEMDALILRLQMHRAEHGDIGVVFIDTLSRVLVGADENSALDMGDAVAAVQYLQKALGCAVVLVHHLGKDAGRGARGHSSLFAAADSVLTIEREKASDTRTLTATKMRDGADGDVVLAFRLQSVDLGAVLDLDPDSGADPSERVTSCVVVQADQVESSEPVRRPIGRVQQAVLDHLAAAGSPITRAQLLQLMKDGGFANPSSTYKAVDSLLHGGLIVEGMHRLYLPDVEQSDR